MGRQAAAVTSTTAPSSGSQPMVRLIPSCLFLTVAVLLISFILTVAWWKGVMVSSMGRQRRAVTRAMVPFLVLPVMGKHELWRHLTVLTAAFQSEPWLRASMGIFMELHRTEAATAMGPSLESPPT